MSDGISAIDEKYEGTSELSLKEIILRHIRKMSDLNCQELTKSYYEKRPVKMGNSVSIIEKYHPDLREAFINATDFLFSLIQSYIPKDKKGFFKKALARIKKSEDSKWKNSKKETQDDWVQKKLELKKELFSEIMLFLNRIKYFSSDEFKE